MLETRPAWILSSGVNQTIPLEWSDILQTAFPEEKTLKKLVINAKEIFLALTIVYFVRIVFCYVFDLK